MLQRLAEADARIQNHLLQRHADRVPHQVQPLGKEFADFPHHVRVGGILLHRRRRTLRVHHDVAGARLGHEPPHREIRARGGGDVVDDARPGLQRGAGDTRLAGVHRDGDLYLRRKFFDDGNDAAQFLRLADRLRAGPRGFAADVKDVRALGDQFQRVRHRRRRVGKFSAVGKGIRRDVDHAHHERGTRKDEFKLAGAEKHG